MNKKTDEYEGMPIKKLNFGLIDEKYYIKNIQGNYIVNKDTIKYEAFQEYFFNIYKDCSSVYYDSLSYYFSLKYSFELDKEKERFTSNNESNMLFVKIIRYLDNHNMNDYHIDAAIELTADYLTDADKNLLYTNYTYIDKLFTRCRDINTKGYNCLDYVDKVISNRYEKFLLV
jgi:hypothetical protein